MSNYRHRGPNPDPLKGYVPKEQHEHMWRVIYGDPATGKPQVEACDLCNLERAIEDLEGKRQ